MPQEPSLGGIGSCSRLLAELACILPLALCLPCCGAMRPAAQGSLSRAHLEGVLYNSIHFLTDVSYEIRDMFPRGAKMQRQQGCRLWAGRPSRPSRPAPYVRATGFGPAWGTGVTSIMQEDKPKSPGCGLRSPRAPAPLGGPPGRTLWPQELV